MQREKEHVQQLLFSVNVVDMTLDAPKISCQSCSLSVTVPGIVTISEKHSNLLQSRSIIHLVESGLGFAINSAIEFRRVHNCACLQIQHIKFRLVRCVVHDEGCDTFSEKRDVCVGLDKHLESTLYRVVHVVAD